MPEPDPDGGAGGDGRPAGSDGDGASDHGAAEDAGARGHGPSDGDGPNERGAAGDAASDEEPLPEDVVEEAERLTRLARRAGDDAEAAAYREERAELLDDRDYAALVRSESDGEVLVCHPQEWLADGDVDPALVEDVERAVEVPLSGASDPDDWEAVAAANEAVASAVREAHGDVHGDNAAAFAEYVSNHYAKRLPEVTAEELQRFREEYYPRNVWPSDEQEAVLERSLELVYEELSVPLPQE